MTNANGLVAYIRAHGHKATHSLLDNVIYVGTPATYYNNVGQLCESANVNLYTWEAIEPKASLVREWLGY